MSEAPKLASRLKNRPGKKLVMFHASKGNDVTDQFNLKTDGSGFTSKPLDQGDTWSKGDREGGFPVPTLPKKMSGRPTDAGRKSVPKGGR